MSKFNKTRNQTELQFTQCHDIAEILLLKLALNTNQSINQFTKVEYKIDTIISYFLLTCSYDVAIVDILLNWH